jgi:molecular chaperone HtpG
MAKKQFKSESKRLLALMVNSIYTHKEIFLREIISNASDAIDKLCYISLTDTRSASRATTSRSISPSIRRGHADRLDNGIGMTKEELESNLGHRAQRVGGVQKESGRKTGRISTSSASSASVFTRFMVASTVMVVTKAYGECDAYKWVSSARTAYRSRPPKKRRSGTDISSNSAGRRGRNYSEFLEEHELHRIIKKYSDYIRWPIVMDVTRAGRWKPTNGRQGNKKKTWEDYTEKEVVNSRIPLWQRSKSEVSDESASSFTRKNSMTWTDPVADHPRERRGLRQLQGDAVHPRQSPVRLLHSRIQGGPAAVHVGRHDHGILRGPAAGAFPVRARRRRLSDLSLNISREMLSTTGS